MLFRSSLAGDAVVTAAATVYYGCIANELWPVLLERWSVWLTEHGWLVGDWVSLSAAVLPASDVYAMEARGLPTDWHSLEAVALLREWPSLPVSTGDPAQVPLACRISIRGIEAGASTGGISLGWLKAEWQVAWREVHGLDCSGFSDSDEQSSGWRVPKC